MSIADGERQVRDGAATIARVCEAIDAGDIVSAATILDREYKFVPRGRYGPVTGCTDSAVSDSGHPHLSILRKSRSLSSDMAVFVRDRFVDRYSGERLIFQGALRVISSLLPAHFPFHRNWKQEVSHGGYKHLQCTIDHIVPLERGGTDDTENLVSTSMYRNNVKANRTLPEMGWSIRLIPIPGGGWDGLTSWFIRQFESHAEFRIFHKEYTAAIRFRDCLSAL